MNSENKSPDEPFSLAWDRLTLILGFFDRVDTKFSFLFGINVALLGVIGAKTPALSEISVGGWLSLAAFSLCCAYGFNQMYRASAPHLEGGRASLIYFNSIAQLDRLVFRDRFNLEHPDERLQDVLDQVWYNSKILSEKYGRLRKAYRALLMSLVPWALALGIFVS